MDFAGFTYLLDGAGSEGWPPNTTMFNQADLGYARDDPELYHDKWHALENRVFDFLDSGHPLTISAEGKSYVLPPVNVPRWRALPKNLLTRCSDPSSLDSGKVK
jgi:hypothetical protein